MKHRRCVRDYKCLPDHHETYIYWPMIHIMTARLAAATLQHHSRQALSQLLTRWWRTRSCSGTVAGRTGAG